MTNKENIRNDPDAAENSVDPETGGNGDASFLGWQGSLKDVVFAVYNVTAPSHPLRGSTVSEKTLRLNNLKVPWTPQAPKPLKKL
jgi:hypothetical protein